MRIVKSLQSKVCVDGSLMKEYLLDEPLTEVFLAYLESFGTVRRYPHLRRPYFSFEQEQFVSIKGFIGDPSVEVRYRKEFVDLISDYFHLLLYYSGEGDTGKNKLLAITGGIREKMKTRTCCVNGSGGSAP